MLNTKVAGKDIEIEYPAGFAGLLLGGSAEELRQRAEGLARAIVEADGAAAELDEHELGEQLARVGERLGRFDVRVFGTFAVGAQASTATLVLASTRLDAGDGAPVRQNRLAATSAMLEQYRQRNPHADARVVELPVGPAVAAVTAGEFRLPAGEAGTDGSVRPMLRAEFQILAPDGAEVIVLDVSTGSEQGWPAVAEAAAAVARSIRVHDSGSDGQERSA